MNESVPFSTTRTARRPWPNCGTGPAIGPLHSRLRKSLPGRRFCNAASNSSLRAVTRGVASHRAVRSSHPRYLRRVDPARPCRAAVAFPGVWGYDAGQKRSDSDQTAFSRALAEAEEKREGSLPSTGLCNTWTVQISLAGRRGQRCEVLCAAPYAPARCFSNSAHRWPPKPLRIRRSIGMDVCCRGMTWVLTRPHLGSSVAAFHQACADRLAGVPGCNVGDRDARPQTWRGPCAPASLC